MSRGAVLRSLAVSALAGLFVVIAIACVPQPANRRTQAPIAVSAAPVTQPPTPTPATPSPSLTFSRPTATPQPTFLAYRVRSGDTITSIAREHDTTVRSIGYWNRTTYPSLDPDSGRYNPDNLRVGWTLLLIPGVEVDPDEITPPPTVAPAAGEETASEEPAD
ncbi:MAG TPA: LysM domain-containing protein [Candidatus Limnocylindrales bacterium]|nr:LysM domain-containing protein [Candidatus Limnocylindrales bacterium]